LARRIILADDSVTAQNMGRRILTDAGYEVITVNNGSAALKKIAEHRPDLIILDVYMPGYGGLEVCSRIKENRDTSRIPVLLTVGKLEPFKAEEARRVRADAFVVKPFEASELLTALTRLEDKIVPGPEPYKQGRFAKAAKALEHEEKPESFGDSDGGWKDRLIIPAKPQSEQAEPEPESIPATSSAPSASHPELDRPAEFKPIEPSREYERPIPSGIPADIRPEEIAAIAAAAAALSKPEGEWTEPAAEAQATTTSEEKTEVAAVEAAAASEAASTEEVPATFASAPETESKPVETPVEEKAPVVEEPSVPAARGLVATIAEALGLRKPAEETREPRREEVSEPEPEVAIAAPVEAEAPTSETVEPTNVEPTTVEAAPEEPAPEKPKVSDAEVLAALASLTPPGGSFSENAEHEKPEVASVLAGVAAAEVALPASTYSGPRWMAEEIPVPENESTLLLEQEMEKSLAALAAADAARDSTATMAAPSEMPVVAEVPAEPIAEVAAVVEAVASTESSSDPAPVVEISAAPEPPVVDAVATSEVAPSAPSETQEVAFAAAAAAGSSSVEPAPVETVSTAAQPAPEALPQQSAKPETDLVARWAKWGSDRDQSGETPEAYPEPPQPEVPAAEAAQPEAEAAAEGSSDPEAIASIVDDMLAELKPKLMAELKKKLDKKKK